MNEIIGSIFENNEINPNSTSRVGTFGEKTAANYLTRRGFRLIVANFRTPIGRNRKGVQVTGEIDLIALDSETLCFVEVKTRTSDEFASPLTAVDLRKQRQIIRTARIYRKTFDIKDTKFRYDAIGVVLNGKKAPSIRFARNFWTESKFKKKVWMDEFHR